MPVGYPRLDALRRDYVEWKKDRKASSESRQLRVIVAPSWGQNAILERHGKELVQILLDGGYHVTVRPHPCTTQQSPHILAEISAAYGYHKSFELETDVRDKATLYGSDVMISDWSGVALEYAFGCEKPVVFIDVPKKKNNPEAERIPEIPVEVSLRERIGRIVSPNNLSEIPEVIAQIYKDQGSFLAEIKKAREGCVFHLDKSASVGAEYIKALAQELSDTNSAGRPP